MRTPYALFVSGNGPVRPVIIALGLTALLVGIPALAAYRHRRQQRLDRALIAAIKRNDTHAALSLLDQGADTNARDLRESHLSPWQEMLTALSGDRRPAPIEAPTSLLLALQANPPNYILPPYFPDRGKIVRALLDHGADVNARTLDIDYASTCSDARVFNSVKHYANSPLLLAVEADRRDLIKQILDHGADVDPDTVESPLQRAVVNQDHEVLLTLLNRGARIDRQDGLTGETALMEAVEAGDIAAVRLLLARHASMAIRDRNGRSALSLAQQDLRQAKGRPALVRQYRLICRMLLRAEAHPG